MDSRLEIAALGRALYPGMLYDCRSDTFIPGVTLWNKESLKSDIDERPKPTTDLKFSASDSLSEKANFLEVNASLKASFLSGLIEVGGSAKYLRDTKSSMSQSRCTMMYSLTTKFQQLTMTQLGNITYPEVFEQKTATHVVTAVLYGAQAFMVFDHMASGTEEQQKIEGNLHAVVKKIPSLNIEGEAKLTLNEDEKKLANEISVTFYGDFHLDHNPTTYQEAVDLYKNLPSVLKDKEYFGVPVKVWLYPLVLLDNKAAALVREISTSLVSKTERVLEQLEDAERRCNDLTRRSTVQDFPDLKVRLQSFRNCYSDYKTVFQKALCSVLPEIRGGGKEEQALAKIIEIHDKSPFAANKLNEWLETFTNESQILNSYTKRLQDIRVVTSLGDLNSILFDPDVDAVVCLAFTSLANPDEFINTLNEFLQSDEFKKLENVFTPRGATEPHQPWFTSFDISQTMRNLSHFKTFSEANKETKGVQFVIASIPDPNNPGTSIRLYEKGKLTNPKFTPVSKPPRPTVTMSDGRGTLTLQKSPTGETVRFRIEYQQANSKDEKKKWEVRDTPDAQESFVLTGLQPGEQYDLRYRAVSEVGVSEASESIRCVPNDLVDWIKDCTVVGGLGGSEFLVVNKLDDMALMKIGVYVGTDQVDAIDVQTRFFQRMTFGIKKEVIFPLEDTFYPETFFEFQEFEFEDGDRFKSLTLWPNKSGTRLAGMAFTIVRENNELKFEAKCTSGDFLGDPVSVDVHSGNCCGVKGRSGLCVDAFGFIFIK
ncbi:cytolytic toxin-alpha-like [Astyanax mexicanus]|uniref:cytolytic toxin-alpha-like n=1 Tax=Astyanax mexicanus TaxID=7994 RepID=UPI0020CA9F7C|nr:cytolytic toxin-alpha-like [Astyanax mexicanus]